MDTASAVAAHQEYHQSSILTDNDGTTNVRGGHGHGGGVCWLRIGNGLLNHWSRVCSGHWGSILHWGSVCSGHWGSICHLRGGGNHGVRRRECGSSCKWHESWQQGRHFNLRLGSRCWCRCSLLLFGCPLLRPLGRGCRNADAAEQQTNQKNPCNDWHAEP